ncbi:MAG TPA: ornithine cyclodeaminase family protein [Myxococcaceae bacterium]|nr:ornithine cyclodeaminase family protein [Myxococcaceae bacterium]
MRTLFLPHAEVVQRLDALSLLAPMRDGFIAHSRGRTAPGLVRATTLPGRGIARVTGVGLVPDLPAYSVSSAATPADGVEHATLLLHDLESGKLLACMEAVHLRAIALALGIAIAADVLARPEASRVAVLGTSDGTLRLLKMLRLVRSLRQIRVLEPRPERAEEVAGRAYRELSLPVRVSQDVEDAVQDAELVLVTAGVTGAAPLKTVPEGCHVAVVDPALRDAAPAAELLSSDLRRRAVVVVDDRSVAREAGWTDAEIDAELGQVLAEPPVRTATEVTVHATVGLPFQELLAAWQVFDSARENPELPRLELTRRRTS